MQIPIAQQHLHEGGANQAHILQTSDLLKHADFPQSNTLEISVFSPNLPAEKD